MFQASYIAISISVIALLVSVFNLYHQHLKKTYKVSVRMISTDISDGKSAVIEYSLGNTGTVLHHLNKMGVLGGKNMKSLKQIDRIDIKGLPAYIEPNKVVSTSITFSLSGYKAAIEAGDVVYMCFEIISPNGKVTNYYHDIRGLTQEHDNNYTIHKTGFMHKPKSNPSGQWRSYN